MAEWKKVIVSGSSAELQDLTLDTALTVVNGGTGLTATGADNFLIGNGATSLTTIGSNGTGTVVRTTGATGLSATGSFTGSFSGTFVGTTDLPDLTDGNGIVDFTYDGSTTATIAVQADGTTLSVGASGVKVADAGITATQLNTSVAGDGLSGGAGTPLAVNVDNSSIETNADTLRVKALGITNAMLAGSIANNKLVNDSVIIGSTEIDLGATATTVAGLTLTGVEATGSFTGSFTGDGSGLTGVPTSLTIDADTGGTGTVDLLTQTFDIAGGTNINTSLSGQTVTVNLDSNISVTDATITGDLVVEGTASFANTENLLIADRFVLFASGSTTTGDGGIVVQQGTQNVGELFGYEATATRWGVDTAFNASDNSFTPQAFMSAVVDIDGGQSDIARYQKNGNIKIDSGEIYIYS